SSAPTRRIARILDGATGLGPAAVLARLVLGGDVVLVAEGLLGLTRLLVRRRLHLWRDRRVRLRQRVREVAEHVSRVVVLDDGLGLRERPPLALAVLGQDLGLEVAVGAQRQPLILVV